MFQSTPLFHRQLFGAKRLTAIKTIATVLMLSPVLVLAELDPALLKLQTVAESNAMELGSAVADTHWTRIEFSKVYVDPIVVVEPLIDNGNNAYVVGIRNIDDMGFEINLKNCNNSPEIPLQETINFSVIDNSQLPSAEQANTAVRQRFAWGECVTAAADITAGGIA